MKIRMAFSLVCLGMMVVLVGGCGCFMQQTKGEAAPPKPPEQQQAAMVEQKQEIVVKAEETPVVAAVPAPQDIYFDFDKYMIRRGDAEILKKTAEVFKAVTGKIRIEGNCDERGTVEYNLALGQKRADAARAYLITLGIDDSRLATISYGKERPVDPGHDEAAWAKNRRDHFSVLDQ